MIITTEELDVAKFLPNQPTTFLKREIDLEGHNDSIALKGHVAPEGIWYVSNKAVPLTPGAFVWREDDYQMTRIGDYVRIPLFEYECGQSAATLFAAGAAIGCVLTAGLPPEFVLLRVHLVVGQVFADAAKNTYVAYLGVGLQLGRRR